MSLDIPLKMNFCNDKYITAQKMKFFIQLALVNVTKSAIDCADFVTFTEEILNGKLRLLCSVSYLSDQQYSTKQYTVQFKYQYLKVEFCQLRRTP